MGDWHDLRHVTGMHRFPHLFVLFAVLLGLGWAWSLQQAYRAGERRLLLRVRELPAESARWQTAPQDHPLLDLHAAAAGRCLSRLRDLYQEEARLWDHYQQLRESAPLVNSRS